MPTLDNSIETKLPRTNWFNTYKNKFVRILMAILLFSIIVLNSGYTLTYLISNTFYKTLIVLVSFVVMGGIFALTVDINKIIERFKKKKPSFCLIAIVVFGVSTILTMLCTGETNDLISYASFGIRILCAFMIAKMFNLKKFISVFQTGLLIITFISIGFSIVQNYLGIKLTPLPDFSSFGGTIYHNYFFIVFQSAFSKRMQGPFWEPGLFATYLLLGLSFEIVFYKKIRWFYLITFIVGILFTRSTFGYLLLVFVFLFLIDKKINKIWILCVLHGLIFVSIILFLIFAEQIIPFMARIMPTLFSKMINRDGSISLLDISRFLSPVTNIKLWLKSPIWGNGLVRSDILFSELSPGLAQTSTITFYLSEFGIFGIAFTFFFFFGMWKVKTIAIDNKLLFTFLFLILFNKEPHASIIFEWVLLFLFIKEGWDKDTTALAFDPPNDGSVIKSFVKKDDASILKRNISISFVIKGLAMVLGFFSYPIFRKYFNNDDVLGIWLTIVSLMSMIISLDFGLGNGLKNKMTEALVKKDKKLQKRLISSSYIVSLIVSATSLIVATIIIATVDLNSFLKIDSTVISPFILKASAFLVCLSLCLELLLKNVNSLLQAKQKQALSSLFALISTALLMIFALVYKNNNSNNLLLSIAIVYVFSINLPLVLGSIFVFITYFRGCLPSFKYIDKSTIKSVGLLGIGFFVIQLFLLAINSTNETFISSIFGASYVVQYTNYFKPFSVISQLFSIATLPYWAMIVKEKEENNIAGLYKNIKSLFMFLGVFTLMCILLSVLFQPFVNVWLGEGALQVDYYLIILFNLLIFETMFAGLFSVVCNGLSIIKEQLVYFGISAILKIGGCLFLYLIKDNIQWYYVISINIIAYSPLVIGETLVAIKAISKIKQRRNYEETEH